MKLYLKFTEAHKGYIADPYLPARYKLIEIQKQSGMNRVRSEAKRRQALEQELKKRGMTYEDYLELERQASQPFHYNGTEEIIIPENNIMSCLVNANYSAPAALRIQNTRVALRASDFRTGRKKADGLWERFVVVTGAQGKLSNQRAYRANSYIRKFVAEGTMDHDKDLVKPDAILELLKFAGQNIGIGACRKMGWGRFIVSRER